MPLVIQHGSNCTVARLNGPRRLNNHAHDLGRAQTLGDYDIAFDVFSQTNGCAASDLVSCPGQRAWGVLYEIPDDFIRGERTDDQKTLAQIEAGLYEEKPIRVQNQVGEEAAAATFLVRPDQRRTGLATSAAYVSWIIYGLRSHGVAEDYIQHVIDIAIETNQRAGGTSAAEQIRLIKTL